MDPVTLELLKKNINDLGKLTAPQLAEVLAALKAYEFPAGSTAADWRVDVLAAIEKQDFRAAALNSIQLTSGTVKFKACT